MSFARLIPELDARVPRWLRNGFLVNLVFYDLIVLAAGVWGLKFQPVQLQKALGDTVLDDVWGWMLVAGSVLALAGAVRAVVMWETVGNLLVWGACCVLAVATYSASLFGDYSVTGALLFLALGWSCVRRIGRVWIGAYLRGVR